MKNEIIFPDYNHSILSTITSILKFYNVNTPYSSLNSLDAKLSKKYKNIVLIILDGMGSHILDNLSPNGFFKSKQLDTVTSVYPSTTTAALTTYYSGQPPIETGWIAWSQYFKEYGRTIDMFSHRESYLGENINFSKLNVFQGIMKHETIFEKIEKASPGVKAYEVTPLYSERRSKRTVTADNLDELLDSINMLCQTNEEKFVMAYCDNPDGLLHKFGTSSREACDFINQAEEKFNKIFGKEFLLLTNQEFLDKHLLGYGKKHPKIDDFIGHYIALSTSSSIIRLETFLAEGKPIKKSTHCGLSKEEMEVPVIILEK